MLGAHVYILVHLLLEAKSLNTGYAINQSSFQLTLQGCLEKPVEIGFLLPQLIELERIWSSIKKKIKAVKEACNSSNLFLLSMLAPILL